MHSKTKEVCILDNNNYFIDVVRVFLDDKTGKLALPPYAHEIPCPNINFIRDGLIAKWNFENQNWNYEETNSSEVTEKQPDPMDVLNVAKDMRLEQTDSMLLEAIELGDNSNLEAIKGYRNELRNIIPKIRNGEMEPPVLNPDPNPFLIKKDPAELIIFDNWPILDIN
jgi:hypothetical protein